MNDMSTIYKRHYLLPALAAGLILGLAGHLPAQTFKVLHTFSAVPRDAVTNSDGAGPNGGLLLSGNTLYGTTRGGGVYGDGTVFTVDTNGGGFTSLHSFQGRRVTANEQGSVPHAGLIS